MEKFVVISCYEREMKEEGVFNTHTEAYDKMEELMKSYFVNELKIEEVEWIEEQSNEWNISDYDAYSNMYNKNYDIKIFRLTI